jgi:RNA polymerase sigma-70 factor (ECF subfamily)
MMSDWTETERSDASPDPGDPRRSDEDLLLAYRDHQDRAAFEQLVHRYESELYNYLWSYLGDAQMAEDAFQLTFLQVHTKCQQFDPQRRVRPWLYTVATHQAIDAQRRNRRHRAASLDRPWGGAHDDYEASTLYAFVDDEELGPADRFVAAEDASYVREAVDRLPETLRRSVLLVFFQGLKYREAAEVLDVPVGTVKSRLHAAIVKLNETLSHGRMASHG